MKKLPGLLFIIIFLSSCQAGWSPDSGQPSDAATQNAEATHEPSPIALTENGVTPDIEAYLYEVLDTVRENALNAEQVDWGEAEADIFARSEGATETKHTYPHINILLSKLKDNHSFFLTPKRAATLAAATLDDYPEISSEMVDSRLGYINIPNFAAIDQAVADEHAQQIQAHLGQSAEQQPCGWIVDLQDNTGGNMYPMLAGLAPLLGDGTLGYFLPPKGEPQTWHLQDGQIMLDDKQMIFVAEPSTVDLSEMPVAVLLNRVTASSGEAVAISFVGRPQTQLFGQNSRGLSTANNGFGLSDGARLILTVSVMSDRNQTPYGAEVVPDVVVDDEMVLETAVSWLLEQPNCVS
ncbi:MAG: S41 family peptidase [Chloroflexota bacterium]